MQLKPLFLFVVLACSGGDPTVSATEAVAAPPSGWSRVAERTTCDPLRPQDCLGAYGFSVSAEGRYTAGPDPVTGRVSTGPLTSAELAALDAAIAAVVPREGERMVPVPPPLTCIDRGETMPLSTASPELALHPVSLPGMGDVVDVEAAGKLEDVYDLGESRVCYLGAGGLAVHATLHALMSKYYPLLLLDIPVPL